ncbi:hypothetical protein [Methylocystis sp. ATCC 49242]|uniref:hypothetical protein n=1 Tax=Methylocystis sp. ATCC 49242 TaxID=622637 RepID=UPI0001F86D3E|nr:hypothetical protein [Methylocystis sp. ATCC 49242]
MCWIAAACAGPGFGGRENIAKRYPIHVAGFNLGVLMRALMGYGTPRERAEATRNAFLFVIRTDSAMAIVMITDIGGALACSPSSPLRNPINQAATSSPRC